MIFGSEFLVHAADVEGLCQGIDEELVASEFRFSVPMFQSLTKFKSWVNGVAFLPPMQEELEVSI